MRTTQKVSKRGLWASHRLRHQGGGEKSRLTSAGIRCASGIAFFNSLGLVSGGLRKQAAILSRLEIVAQNRFDSAAEFLAIIGPNPLSPVAVTTGLRAEQMKERISIAWVAGWDARLQDLLIKT